MCRARRRIEGSAVTAVPGLQSPNAAAPRPPVLDLLRCWGSGRDQRFAQGENWRLLVRGAVYFGDASSGGFDLGVKDQSMAHLKGRANGGQAVRITVKGLRPYHADAERRDALFNRQSSDPRVLLR